MSLTTIADFQRLNSRIYQKQNAVYYSDPKDICIKISRYWSHTTKSIRKGTPDLRLNFAMMAFWGFALANHYDTNLPGGFWYCYPDCCPYCAGKPCDCKPNNKSGRVTFGEEGMALDATFSKYQLMSRAVYPKNTLLTSSWHVTEEVGELGEAVQAFEKSQNDDALFAEIRVELVDVYMNMIGVLNCLKRTRFEFADALDETFRDGCPVCRKGECK